MSVILTSPIYELILRLTLSSRLHNYASTRHRPARPLASIYSTADSTADSGLTHSKLPLRLMGF